MSNESPLTDAAQLADPLLENVFTLRLDLRVETRVENERQYIVVEDRARGKFFRVGESEYEVIAMIDGERSGHQIAQLLVDSVHNSQAAGSESSWVASGNQVELDSVKDRVRRVFQFLLNSNLVYGDRIDTGKRLNTQSDAIERSKVMGWMNPISIKFTLFNPNQLLNRIQPWTNWLFSTSFFVMWSFVAMIAMWTIATKWDQLASASNGILSGNGWVWLLVTWLLLKVVHEAAHGLACRRYGGEVPEAGVLLLLFTPMAYVNVTSMWRFSNRWHRMVVAGAGMYVELLIAFISIIVWSHSTGTTSDIAFNVFLMASVTTILFNANPLMRFDGYFLLADLLAIANLYTKGTKWVSARLLSACFGIEEQSVEINAAEKFTVMTYGILAYLWKLSIGIGLVLGASVLFQGAGLIISAIACVLWYGVPVYRRVALHWKDRASPSHRSIDMRRTCVSIALMFLFLVVSFRFVQAPACKSAPAIVQFADEQIIRADADGFVKVIHVVDGQAVKRGQCLLELENPVLENEVVELQRLLEESEIQGRIYRDEKKQALAQAERQKSEQLQKQIREKETQAQGLIVTAPFDGFVFERELHHRIGSFLHRGDPLMTAAKREQKEVVVSVDQRDFDSVSWQKGAKLRVVFPGRKVSFARLVSIDPRATQTPEQPSLCAALGGPLPVRQSSSQASEIPYELLHPRFKVNLELPREEASRLCSGQRGSAFFRATEQSIGSYFYLAIHDWLTNKLEVATGIR